MPATITGIVFNDLNHNGQHNVGEPGISGAYVVLYSAGSCVTAQTDSGGNYSFTVAAAGDYTVYETVGNPGSTCPPVSFTQPSGFSMSNGPRQRAVSVTAAQIANNTTIPSQDFGHDATIAPLECSPTMVQFVGTPSNWYNIDVVTGVASFYTGVNPADDVNAIGYNGLDNYIYGYDLTTNNIVRVDKAGNLITLSPLPTGLPTNLFDTGTIDTNGFYYLFESESDRFYTVDLRPNSPTFMKLVDPANGYTEQISNYGTALSTAIDTADWVYNSKDGFLYGVGTDGTVQRIDPTTGVVTPLTTTGPNPGDFFGAAAVDANGNIFAISDSDGSIYHYTIDENAATGEFFASTVFATFNDATMCPRATVDIDYGDAPDLGAGNGPGNYNTLLAQNGPRHQIINTLYLGTQVTGEKDAYQSPTANGDDISMGVPDDGLTVPLPTLSISATAYSLSAMVTNQTGMPANLYAWVDFNQNGLFESFEAAPVQVVPSAIGTQTVELSFSVPAGTTLSEGSTFVRLRLTTDELTDSGLEAQDTRSVGPATDGEVEDFMLNLDSVADLEIVKTGPDTAIAGEELEYSLTVTNNGPDAASNVTLNDAVPAEILNPEYSTDGGTAWNPWPGTFTVHSLDTGESVEILIRGTISAAATGTVTNITTVTSDAEDPNPDNNTSTVVTTIDSSADLAVDKTASPDPATAGEVLTFTITVTNAGPSDARDVLLSDAVSSQILSPEFSTDGGTIWNTWLSPYQIGAVSAGGTTTILIRGEVDPSATGSISNTAEVTSTTTDPNPDDNTITIDVPLESSADLAITKLASPDPVGTGEELIYTVIATNAGPSEADNVIITDEIPAGIENAEFSTDNGVTWNPWVSPYTVGTVADGGVVVILIRGAVSASAFGTLTNTASVDSDTPDPDPDDNSSTTETEILASAGLSITKTGDTNPVASGGVLTYTITAVNAGPSDAQEVMITDAVPAEIQSPEFSTDDGATWNPWSGSYSAGTVAAGGSVEILLRGTVNPAATGTIVNTAVVSSSTPDPDPGDDSDTEITAVNALADLSVTKTASPNPAVSGQLLTYAIEIVNAGPDAAENVVLTDTLPTVLLNTLFSTDGGVTWNPWTGSYNAGTIASDANVTILIHGMVDHAASGLISNTVEVTSSTPDLDPDDNTYTETIGIDQSADLSVTKTAAPSPLYAGQELTYTVTVSNAGPSDAANVRLEDVLDGNISNPEFSTDGGTTWNPWVSPYVIGTIASGGNASVQIRGTVNLSTEGRIGNTATVTTDTPDPNPDNNTVTIETPVGQLADLSVIKSGSPDPILPGQTISYTVTVSNAGPSTSQSAVIVDAPPSTVSSAEYSVDGGSTWTAWTGSLNLGSILPDAPVTVLLRGKLSSSATGTVENTVTVTSTTPDPDPGNNSDTETITITPAADIGVVKTALTTPAIAGTRETFVITVSNAGPLSATNVTLADIVPSLLSNPEYSVNAGSTWNPWVSPYLVGTLAPGESRTIQIRGAVDSSATESFTNTATVTSDLDDPNPDNNTSTVEVQVDRSADLSVTKTADKTPAVVGETLVYTVVVTNNGPSDTDNVTITDMLPSSFMGARISIDGGATWQAFVDPYNLGTMTNGESRTVLIQGLIIPTLDSSAVNTVSVNSDAPDPAPDDNSDTVTVPLVTSADISVVKSADTDEAVFGDIITYTLDVSNAGPSPAQSVTLSDALPSGLSSGEYSLDGGTTWQAWSSPYSLGEMAANATQTIKVRGTVNTGAESVITNTATVSSPTSDPDTTNNTSEADVDIIFANLSITKIADSEIVSPGDAILYTVTVSNEGPNNAENAVITDTISSAITEPVYSLDGGATWSAWPGSLALGTLPAGVGSSVLISGTVSSTASGTIVNTATITSDTPDPNPSDNTVTVETPVDASADLTIVKTGSPNPVTAGEQLTYTVSISNAGPSDAQNVVLTDEVPAALTGAEVSTDGGLTWTPWVSPFPIGIVASGATTEILIQGTVAPSATGSIENTATVSSDTPDPDPSGNTSTDETDVDTSADLEAEKTANVSHAAPGDTIEYTVKVQNKGPSDADGVNITDTAPQGLDNVEFSADGGTTWQPWVSPYSAGTLPGGESASILIRGVVQPGAGTITNTAVVSSNTPDPDPDNNTSTVVIQTDGSADLSIKKTVTPAGAIPCGLVYYTLTVSNLGPDTAIQTVLTDHLSHLLCYPRYSLDKAKTWQPWWGTVNLGDIPPGESRTVVIAANIHPCARGEIRNAAYVKSQTYDPNTDNNHASTCIYVCRPC